MPPVPPTSDLVAQLLQSGILKSYTASPGAQTMGALGAGGGGNSGLANIPGMSMDAGYYASPDASAIPLGGLGSTGPTPPPGPGFYSSGPSAPLALGPGGVPTSSAIPGAVRSATGTIDPYAEELLRGAGGGAAETLAGQAMGGAGAAEGALGFLGRLKGSYASKLGFLGEGSEVGLMKGAGGLLKGGAQGLAIGTAGHLLGGAIGGAPGHVINDAANGAALGMMLGPEGAVIGGGLGAVYGLLKGHKKGTDFNTTLDKMSGQANLTGADVSEMKLTYSILKQTGLSDKDARAQVGQMALGKIQTGSQAASDQSKMLATQALTAQFFQPYTDQLIQSAQMRHQATQSLLPSLPAEYRGVVAAQDAASLDNSTRVANAYAAQAQLLPAFASMQAQQSLAQQAAQRTASTALGGGGAQTLQSLLAGG